jgi:hypothetical protein
MLVEFHEQHVIRSNPKHSGSNNIGDYIHNSLSIDSEGDKIGGYLTITNIRKKQDIPALLV